MFLSPAIVINEQFLSLMLNSITFVGIFPTCTFSAHVFKMLQYFTELMTVFRGSGHYLKKNSQ